MTALLDIVNALNDPNCLDLLNDVNGMLTLVNDTNQSFNTVDAAFLQTVIDLIANTTVIILEEIATCQAMTTSKFLLKKIEIFVIFQNLKMKVKFFGN